MRQKSGPVKAPAEQVVKDIRRATRRHFSAEEKIRIVLEGLRGEDSIAELCRREGIVQNLYYRWSKEFLEAGKKRLAGDTARAATSDEVKDLRREAQRSEGGRGRSHPGEPSAQKKHDRRMGRTTHEIPRIREARDHPAGRAIASAGAPHAGEARHPQGDLLPLVRSVSDRRAGGPRRPLAAPGSGLEPHPGRCPRTDQDLALDEPELSPRELAVRFTDTESYFVSEASVYRLLKAHDLITSPAFIVMKAADEFTDKTTAPNQLWQTDFTYLKVIGWGWFYLSTVLDDFSRYIIAWKLCTTMKAEDVTATLDLALKASGLDQATVVHRPRLLSDNGSSYISADLAKWLDGQDMDHVRGAPLLYARMRPKRRFPMLRIIDGKRYDTETANLICDISPNDFHYGDFRYESTHLYRTGKGTWFIAGGVAPSSRWAQPVGQSGKCSGEGIQIITDEEARDLIEHHGKPEQVEESFNVEDA